MITYKLSEIAQSTKGKKPKSVSKEKTEGFEIPYVDIKAFEKGIVDNYTDGENCTFCKPDDVLIVWDGARCGFVGRGVEGAIGSTLAKISSEKYTNDFLFYFLQSKYKILNSNPRGVGIPHIEPNLLWNFEIPDVGKTTQRAIVARIETLFAELDKGVEKLKTAQQQLKVYKQAVLNDCLTKGSEKWNCIEIEKVADVVSGYAFKSNLFKEVGTFQVIRIGNVKPGKIRKNENPVFYEDVPDKVLEKTLLKCNDVVITLTGTRKKRDYGFTALIDCENLLLNQRLAYFRFNQSIYNPKFFLYYTWTDLFKDDFFSYETGNVGQGNVGVKAITKTKIPLPSLPEQQRIVQEIETRLSQAELVEASIEQSLQQAEALRQSILKKAFSGELVKK